MKILKRILIITFLILALLVIFFPKKAAVISMIIGGKVIAPEASAVLSHYCFGNGDTLYLKSDYIKNSPVVLEKIKTLTIGEPQRITFKQKEDWRLSYALNPFHIKKTSDGYLIYEKIEFDTKGQIFTELNFGIFKLAIKDNLPHAFECKSFVAVCKFNY